MASVGSVLAQIWVSNVTLSLARVCDRAKPARRRPRSFSPPHSALAIIWPTCWRTCLQFAIVASPARPSSSPASRAKAGRLACNQVELLRVKRVRVRALLHALGSLMSNKE